MLEGNRKFVSCIRCFRKGTREHNNIALTLFLSYSDFMVKLQDTKCQTYQVVNPMLVFISVDPLARKLKDAVSLFHKPFQYHRVSNFVLSIVLTFSFSQLHWALNNKCIAKLITDSIEYKVFRASDFSRIFASP